MRQSQALTVMMSGESVFLTGAPGAGKTYVLNKFVALARRGGKKVALTASTGIAATHIGGTTIHSWSGLGIKESLSQWDLDKLSSNSMYATRYVGTDVLVIDEVSMLHGSRLDMLDLAMRYIRKVDAPFGGMQIILVGDLFQLPPVTRGGLRIDFVHQSRSWQELDPRICYITEQHRVAEGDGLLDVLQSMRRGDINEFHETMLQERIQATPEKGEAVTRLYTHNIDVDAINSAQLAKLRGNTHRFTMFQTGKKTKRETLIKNVLAPEILELKKGAEVMFVANNYNHGYANGTRGRIVDFVGESPIVVTTDNREIRVEPNTWSMEEDARTVAEVVQIPLRLAWAITIHKSQGMSLDAAEIDLSRAFTPGMGYVALSRARSLDGVYLRGANQMAFAMQPEIFKLDVELMKKSTVLAENIEDYK